MGSIFSFINFFCFFLSNENPMTRQNLIVCCGFFHLSSFPGNKVVLTQNVALAQVQAQAQAAVGQNTTNHHLSNKRTSQAAAAAAAAAAQISQLPQVAQVVSKMSTQSSGQRSSATNAAQLSITQTTTPQVSVTQSQGQGSGLMQLPPGVVHLNNMPIVVRPPPPKEMRNKSVQCKPPEDEDQRDIDRLEEVVTGKSAYFFFFYVPPF